MFANPVALSLEGGPSNVAMIMDWREMVGKATIEEGVGEYTRLPASLGRRPSWSDVTLPPISSKKNDEADQENAAPVVSQDEVEQSLQHLQDGSFEGREYTDRYAAADPIRGWLLGLAWVGASAVE